MAQYGPGDKPAVVRRRARRNRKPKPPSATDVQRATRGAAPLSQKPVRPKRVQRPPSAKTVQQQTAGARPLSQRPTRPQQVRPPTTARPLASRPPQGVRAGRPVDDAKAKRGVAVAAYNQLSGAGKRGHLAGAQKRVLQGKATEGDVAILHAHSTRVAGNRKRVAATQAFNALTGTTAADVAGTSTAAVKAAKKADDTVKKAKKPDKPLSAAGISSSVLKTLTEGVPILKGIVPVAKKLDVKAKDLEAPAVAALKNIDRPANALRGELKRDISQHGVKQFLVGAPHKASGKELKDIRQTAKRHVELKEETTGSDVLKAAGVKNKTVRAIGGFGVDVASASATLPVGGLGSSAARAGEKAAVRAAAKGSRFSRPVRKAARGARAGAVARGASRAEQRVVVRQARRTARGRALKLAERKRRAAVAAREAPARGRAARVVRKGAARVLPKRAARAVGRATGRKAKTGRGVGLRYAGMEIPGTRAATAAVGRGARKALRKAPARTEGERRAVREFAQAERSARGAKEQAMSRAQRVARRALKDLTPADHERVVQALSNNDIKSLDDDRLIRAAVDLRSAFRHEFKTERQAGVSTVRHPENFLTKAERKSLQNAVAVQQREVKRSVQSAQRTHERARGVAQRHGAVADVRHGTERVPGTLETRVNVKADEAIAQVRRHTERKKGAASLPQKGRGPGVPLAETDRAYLQRVVAHAAKHDLPKVRQRAEDLLAKAPGDVERGYFPREFADRAERQAGLAEPKPAQGGVRAVRTGTARTATPATGGRARVDPRSFSVVQAERAAAGEERFSTNVPLVAGSRVRTAGRAVAEADFARNIASHGRTVRSIDELRPGEKLYVLGHRGGKYGLHAARSIPKKPRGGQHVALPEHTVQAMEAANRPMPAVEAKLWDKLTGGWKTLQTYSPRFHLRNAYGDIQRLAEMPGNPLGTLGKLGAGTKAARAVRQSERYRQTPGLRGLNDPLNKATIKVAGKDMPARQFVDMLREHKLIDVGRTQQERAEAAMMRGRSPTEGNILRGGPFQGMQGGPFGGRVGRTLSVDTPNAIRATAFKAGLDGGLSPAEAADRAHKFFVDYGKLSAKERIYARRIFPFYTWTSRSLPVTLANYALRPARYANLNNARNEWNQAVTGLGPDELEAQMKPYTRNNLPVVIPIGGGNYAAVSASWPANLVQYVPSGIGPKALAGAGAQFYKLGAGQLNWIARDLVEVGLGTATHGAGVNLQTGRAIEDPQSPRVKAPSWAKDLPPWAKKDLLVDHRPNKDTGKDEVTWRGWANWALRQLSIGLAGQAAQATDTARAGRINTSPAKIAEFLGVSVEDFGPDVTKADQQIQKYRRVAQLNKRLQQLPEGVNKDNQTPEYRKLRDELNKLNRELRPTKPKATKGVDIGLGSGGGPKVDIGLGKSAGPKVDIGLGG